MRYALYCPHHNVALRYDAEDDSWFCPAVGCRTQPLTNEEHQQIIQTANTNDEENAT